MHTKRVWFCLLSIGLMLWSTGCANQLTPEQLPQALLNELDQVESYQISFLLESSGQSLQVEQWYRSPDSVRTDLFEQGEPTYRFISGASRLLMLHLPSGYRQQVTLSADSQLFCTPLLLDYCRLASSGSWQQESESGLFVSCFSWSAADGSDRTGRIWVDPASLMPTQFELAFGQQETLYIKVQSITLNPTLSDNLFSLGS